MIRRPSAWRIVLLVLIGLGTTASFAQQRPTFQSSVRVVQANVLVHDKNGRPVADLKASDFKIYEDGKEQTIQVFAIETTGGGKPSGQASGGGNSSGVPFVFSNTVSERAAGGVTVLLFDRLNSAWEDQEQARDQIVKFLAGIQPTDHVALYVLESDVVRVLHDFTTDSSRLIRILNRYVGKTSIELDASDDTPDDFARIGNARLDAETEAWLKQAAQAVSSNYLKRRQEATAAALEGIANHLAGIRGRKNLVWVSSAFPFIFKDELGFNQISNREVSRATRAMNNANIAVYPVDIRGLIGPFVNPATATATYNKGSAPPAVFSTMATTHPNQDTMRTIAEDTGGRAYFNSNAIGQAVRRAIEDSRVSYVLGYYPSRPDWDGKFRQITVKVNRSDVDVRHRKGYLALAPPERIGTKARADALNGVARNPLEATAIGLMAEIDQSNLIVRVDAGALTWDQRGDTREGVIDILIAQSLPDGRVFTIKEGTINLSADAERYALMLKEGFTLTASVALHPDAYRLHVVVSDGPTAATGSLIIPADRVRSATQAK